MITVGVDIGGTNIRAAVLREDGRLSNAARKRLEDKSPEAVMEAASALALEIMGQSGLEPEDVGAAGVALAGQILDGSGFVEIAPNLEWTDVPFGEMLSASLPFPVLLENDLSAAAWGERTAGAGAGLDDVTFVSVGTGVGAGIIAAGNLLRGCRGVAGEIGHIKVVPGGEPCGCGENGCLEAYTGGRRMALRTERLRAEAGVPVGEPATTRSLHRDFEAGDEIARRVIEEAGDHLGLAVANLVTILNPSRLVLGGGVLGSVPYLEQRVRTAVDTLTSRPARSKVTVVSTALGDDAGLIGAAHLARSSARLP